MCNPVVVSAAQYERLTAPDHPSEVPSALREIVLRLRECEAIERAVIADAQRAR